MGRWSLRLLRDAGRAWRQPMTRRLLGVLVCLWLFDRAVFFATETQWQNAAGFGGAWRVRIEAQLLLFGAAFSFTLICALLLCPLAQLPARAPHLPRQYAWLERRLLLFNRFNNHAAFVLVVGGAWWNSWMAASFWPQWLLFRHGGKWNENAPLWGIDFGWWTFDLPFWSLLLRAAKNALLIAIFCGFLLALGRGAARFLNRRPALPRRVARCLALLGMAFFAVRAAQCVLMPFAESATLGFDAGTWFGRRFAWWIAAVFNLLPVGFLVWFLVREFFDNRRFLQSLGLAFGVPPLLIFVMARGAFLLESDASFSIARREAAASAWCLENVKIENWQPLKSKRIAPDDGKFLRQLVLPKDDLTPSKIGPTMPLNSIFWRVLWSWRQRKLLPPSSFAPYQDVESQGAAIAPFLWLGGPTRRMKIEGQTFFLTEWLWASDQFPGAAWETLDKDRQTWPVNAARPAVLQVLNAQSGELKFYALSDAPDAMLQAWQNALPGVILPLAQLPPALRSARRYPAELLKRQAHQLSQIEGASWHLAPQNFPFVPQKTQEPHLIAPNEDSLDMQVILCGDTLGENLAALLRARCSAKSFGQLSLLRFDAKESDLPPLDSGLAGLGPFAARLLDELPEDNVLQDDKTVTLRPWATENGRVFAHEFAHQQRVWLIQPLIRERVAGSSQPAENVEKGVALMDASWRDGPVGVGRDAASAFQDWTRLARIWEAGEATPTTENLARRLQVLLEPQKAYDTAQIAEWVRQAQALHEAADRAEKTDRIQAQLLREQELKILQNLQKLAPMPESSSAATSK